MKQIEELIRGEISAVQSFDKVLSKINNDSEKSELSSMKQDHVQAVDKLKQYVGQDFKTENMSSGPWGAFTQAFAGGASFFGDKAALNALKVGEQHGFNEYKVACEDRNINPELKRIIETELLPNQQKHIQTIDRYLH